MAKQPWKLWRHERKGNHLPNWVCQTKTQVPSARETALKTLQHSCASRACLQIDLFISTHVPFSVLSLLRKHPAPPPTAKTLHRARAMPRPSSEQGSGPIFHFKHSCLQDRKQNKSSFKPCRSPFSTRHWLGDRLSAGTDLVHSERREWPRLTAIPCSIRSSPCPRLLTDPYGWHFGCGAKTSRDSLARQTNASGETLYLPTSSCSEEQEIPSSCWKRDHEEKFWGQNEKDPPWIYKKIHKLC